MSHREAAIADTAEGILRREDRIVLADRLGADYRVILTTTGTGRILTSDPAAFQSGKLFIDLAEPESDSLDGLMTASHDRP